MVSLLVITLSGALPLAAVLDARPGGPAAVPAPRGWSQLSLPPGLARRETGITGWELLALPAPAADPQAAAVPGPAPAPGPGAAPAQLPVRVCGHLREEGDDVYFFLDTGKGRWFRLVAGAADDISGIALEAGDGTAAPVIVDLRGGRRYRVLRDEAGHYMTREIHPDSGEF